jgi:ADP-heptose:LPS heptosyltransferase
MTRILAARLDNDGDVLVTGPAIRALAAGAGPGGAVDLLASPAGAAAGRLLPGVREVLLFAAPWNGYRPPPVDPAAVDALVRRVADRGYDEAVIFTSFHQSPLPLALLLRLAGVPRISATSEDYPGALLDVRHQREVPGAPERHEVAAALDLVRAAGHAPPPGDDGRPAVRRPLPDPAEALPELPARPYVVLHPGASVPARAPSPDRARAYARALVAAGWAVVVTGGPGERALTAVVAGGLPGVVDLGGRTPYPLLAAVLDRAACVVVGNTGPAHLAAAVGTPVVSLFSPVVPLQRWGPCGAPRVVLGDQQAACRGSRARDCPVPGHPCLDGISPQEVVAAVRFLAEAAPAAPAGLVPALPEARP